VCRTTAILCFDWAAACHGGHGAHLLHGLHSGRAVPVLVDPTRPAFLGGAAAAAGIALINSVGNLAGIVIPYLVGWIKDITKSTDIGLYCVALSLVVAEAFVLTVP